jgi:cellulose synthase/poly-beta-1,6-N-acetylglucosamine synthase-like glycosyltransferase
MIVLAIILFCVLSVKLGAIIVFKTLFKHTNQVVNRPEVPVVSVLVAARNEEAGLARCIESLLRQDYPENKIEILLGNDQSTDNTASICAAYAAQYPFVKSITISEQYQGLIAKSNVLAQLIAATKGELFATIDADMVASTGWLRSMVQGTHTGAGLVSGYTAVDSDNLVSGIQRIDWMNSLLVLKAAADLARPITVLGNNNLITRKAYEAIGGFESLGPTYTEDNDLTISIHQAGFQVFHIVNHHVAITRPMESVSALFAQRKRWIAGALRHSIGKVLLMFLSRSYMLWALVLMVMNFRLGLLSVTIYLVLDLVQAAMISRRTRTRFSLFTLLVTPFFNSVFDTFTLLSLPFSKRVKWKNRKL